MDDVLSEVRRFLEGMRLRNEWPMAMNRPRLCRSGLKVGELRRISFSDYETSALRFVDVTEEIGA